MVAVVRKNRKTREVAGEKNSGNVKVRQGKMKCERICHLKKSYLEKSVLY